VEAVGQDPPAIETEAVDFAGADQLVALRGFDAGKQPGKFFHKVYEDLDFAADDRRLLEQVVDERLRRYGFEDERWTPVVSAAVEQTLDVVIDPDTELRLRDLTPGRRLDELRFVLPAAGGAAGGGRRVTPASLAAVFATHGGERLARYAARLERLEFGALRGYLTGVIDLVFEHRGKWYVVDYKSNLLGAHARDYAAARLWEPMAAHHYVLQYHLYVLALHRYLGYRRPGYEFDEHFGGVFYLFLRGLTERTGSACGVFADRPSGELIEALSRLFDGRDRTEGGVT
jgi:exodeoxyribonuclease V beta subunit